jgi:hypothetical protein
VGIIPGSIHDSYQYAMASRMHNGKISVAPSLRNLALESRNVVTALLALARLRLDLRE